MTFNKKIIETLSKLGSSGEFAMDDSHAFVYPGLVVNGVGEIAFPLPKEQALCLIEQSHKAPFGKGSATLVDESVRKTWEINAEDVQLNGVEWPVLLETIVDRAKAELGLEDIPVKANLYKLLIYEPGGFFKQHKDSEKEKGMFGTLVVALPSVHEGGEIIVHFGGQSKTLRLDEPASKFQIGYAAFYADCDHEISPVAGGYRLTLVYNLVQNSAKNPLKPEDIGSVVNELSSLLQQKKAHSEPLVYLLGHQYTQENFGENALKLDDRTCARALSEAAAKAGLFAQLCLVTHYMMGELEQTTRSYRGRRRWNDYDDIDDQDGEMGEVYEESSSISYWDKTHFPGLSNDYPIDETDCINKLNLEDDPLEKEAEGFTGNAGMTMTHWYHYGAVFIWSPTKHPALVIDSDPKTVLAWLNHHRNHWDKDNGRSQQLAKNIVQAWADAPPTRANNSDVALDVQPLVAVLSKIGDPKLIEECTDLLAVFASDLVHSGWWELHSEFREHDFVPVVEQYLKIPQIETVKHISDIIMRWGSTSNLPKHHQRFFDGIMDSLPKYLDGLEWTYRPVYGPNKRDLFPKKFSTELINNILCASAHRNEASAWREAMVQILTKETTREYVNEVVIAGLQLTAQQGISGSILYEMLRSWALAQLEHRVHNKPQPPTDWRRTIPSDESRFGGKNWDVLRAFMESPTQSIFEYRAPQQLRSEMESTIESNRADLSLQTIKKGSPHTLLLTKTSASYDKALANWKIDVALMEKMLASNE